MAIIDVKEIEDRIGLTAGGGKWTQTQLISRLETNDMAAAILQTELRLWLEGKGIPPYSAKRATNDQLSKGYAIENYLNGWKRNERERRGSAISGGKLTNLSELLASDDEDEGDGVAEARGVAEAKAGLTPEELAKSQAFADSVNAIVNERFAAMGLSDKLKGEIASIARVAAEASALRALKEHLPPREIALRDSTTGKLENIGLQHKQFEELLMSCGARDMQGFRMNIWLTGAAAAGKTRAAQEVAKALENTFTSYRKDDTGHWTVYNPDGTVPDMGGMEHDGPFAAESCLEAAYQITGHKDGAGRFHWTPFLRVFVYGGVIVCDELDGWQPGALLAANGPLANGWISTPIGMFERHKDCIIIAAANTWGFGATNEYSARQIIDGASRDRFVKIEWEIDEKLERAVAIRMDSDLPGDSVGAVAWHELVMKARKNARTHGLEIIISPRATYYGISLMKQGFSRDKALKMTILAGLDADQIGHLGLTPGLRSVA